ATTLPSTKHLMPGWYSPLTLATKPACSSVVRRRNAVGRGMPVRAARSASENRGSRNENALNRSRAFAAASTVYLLIETGFARRFTGRNGISQSKLRVNGEVGTVVYHFARDSVLRIRDCRVRDGRRGGAEASRRRTARFRGIPDYGQAGWEGP